MATRVDLRHVHSFKDRHGRQRHYLRVPGQKSVALPGEPGSVQFMTAYTTGLAKAAKPEIAEARSTPGTLDALAVSYYASQAFRDLKESTQQAYRRIVERLRAKNGAKPIRLLDAQGIRKLMTAHSTQPTAANHLLRMIRLLVTHAIDEEILTQDPTIGVKPHKIDSEGFATWSEEEIAMFRARHPSGTVPRLALELLVNTGQRRSDVVRMGRQHVRDGAIHLRQVKTGNAVSVPILPELQAELDQITHSHLTYLARTSGKARSPRGFYNTFAEWCREAGVPEGRSPHGLRKACGVRLAEAGCTAHEIMAILGHKTLSEAQKYTQEADRKKLGRSAMEKVAAIGRAKQSRN